MSARRIGRSSARRRWVVPALYDIRLRVVVDVVAAVDALDDRYRDARAVSRRYDGLTRLACDAAGGVVAVVDVRAVLIRLDEAPPESPELDAERDGKIGALVRSDDEVRALVGRAACDDFEAVADLRNRVDARIVNRRAEALGLPPPQY